MASHLRLKNYPQAGRRAGHTTRRRDAGRDHPPAGGTPGWTIHPQAGRTAGPTALRRDAPRDHPPQAGRMRDIYKSLRVKFLQVIFWQSCNAMSFGQASGCSYFNSTSVKWMS